MSGMKPVKSLSSWILVGTALDAAVLSSIWALINACGQWSSATLFYLGILALLTAPWVVHVVTLPALFRLGPRIDPVTFAGITFAYIIICGLALIPMFAPAIFFLFAGLGWLALGGLRWVAEHAKIVSPNFINQIGGYFFMIVFPTLMGAIFGLFLCGLRDLLFSRLKTSDTSHPEFPRPSLRSDVLGGAIAGFICFSGTFVASELIGRVPAQPFHYSSADHALQFPTILFIGVVALLPHLVMTGYETFRTAPKKGAQHVGD